MGWEPARHRVRGQGRKQFRLWARKGSDDTLDATISWEPKGEFLPGRWRRDPVGAGGAAALDPDVYDHEKERLERELAELEKRKPNFV